MRLPTLSSFLLLAPVLVSGIAQDTTELDRVATIESTYRDMSVWADNAKRTLSDYEGGANIKLSFLNRQSRKIMSHAKELYDQSGPFAPQESGAIANGTTSMRAHAVDLVNMLALKAHYIKDIGVGSIARKTIEDLSNQDNALLRTIADKVTVEYRSSVQNDSQGIVDAYEAAIRHF